MFVGRQHHMNCVSVLSFRIVQRDLQYRNLHSLTFATKDEAELKVVLCGLLVTSSHGPPLPSVGDFPTTLCTATSHHRV